MPLIVDDAKELLAPFKKFCNKQALSAVYRTLRITPDRVTAASANGLLEVLCELGLEAEALVDATAFLALLDSLPSTEELALSVDKSVLQWTCGSAKGRLALAALENLPTLGKMGKPTWQPPVGFIDLLRAGGLSCQASTLASVGMHGVSLHFDEEAVRACSSDNLSISMATLEIEGLPPGLSGDPLTFAPEATTLLADLIAEDGAILFRDDYIYYRDAGTRLLLKQIAPLKHDLVKGASRFAGRKLLATIPKERISAFIKRATSLSEAKRNSTVTLRAEHGQLSLEFSENTAASDEYYLVDGLALADELEIKVDAVRLSRALAYVDRVALDHVGEGALIFIGEDPDFVYSIAGKK
jgi:hypothetical protein